MIEIACRITCTGIAMFGGACALGLMTIGVPTGQKIANIIAPIGGVVFIVGVMLMIWTH